MAVARIATVILLAGAALGLPTVVPAAPPVLEETARIPPPEPGFLWMGPLTMSMLAVDGDRIVAAAFEAFDNNGRQAVFLFERSASGIWSPTKLFETIPPGGPRSQTMIVDIKGDTVAVLSSNRLIVFERTASGWSQTANLDVQGGNPSVDVAVDAGTIVVGTTTTVNGVVHSAGVAYRKNASGQWSYVTTLIAGETGGATHENYAANVTMSGNSIVLAHFQAVSPQEVRTSAHVFEGAPGAWSRTAILTDPPGFRLFLTHVGFDGNNVIMDGIPDIGPSKVAVFARTGGTWTYDTSITQIGSPEQVRIDMTDIAAISADGGTAALGLYIDEDRGGEAGSIMVYKRGVNGDASYQPVAKLLASDALQQTGLGRGVDISGNRIVSVGADTAAGGDTNIYVFDLPTTLVQPDVIQDDFQDGNANGWLSTPSNAWSIVTRSGSRVYRTSNLGANSVSVRSGVDWTNQAVEAYIRPTAVSGADRWFGLFVRQSDSANYYYVTVRSSNVVQIRRMLNGSFVTLASAPLPFTLNSTYRLRLEAIGTWLRVYVDDRLTLQTRDSALTHGQAGLRTFRAAAEYDNVVISPNPSLRLLTDSFFFDPDDPDFVPRERRQWIHTGSGSWAVAEGGTFVQSSTAADAKAIAGIDVDDLVLDAWLLPNAFNGNDRWFGLITRYQDDANYYYVTLRSSNRISLRKLINGTITVLDSAPLTVTPVTSTWFNVRMENIDTALRVYVNGRLTLEASDTTYQKGRYGLATFKAAAQFDDVVVRQP